MTKFTPRNLDHLVLPVPDLDSAREQFSKLGFNVAPDARHKFGSENACIFFKDGTFLEPLAIGHRETVESAIVKGNTFLRRDFGFRFRQGDDGFSCVVVGDQDPRELRKSFKKAGYETGKLVTVRRPGVKVDIAFILDERAPDFSLFACERPDGPPKFDAKLIKHNNTAKGITNVTLFEPVPSDFQYYLQTAIGQREVRSHSFGMEMKFNNANLNVLNEDGMSEYYGCKEIPQARGLRALAYDIEVKSLSAAKDILKENSIASEQIGHRLIVQPTEGQGAIIAFQEAK